MFGQNVKGLWPLLLLLFCVNAHAKKMSFASGTPFGLGFRGGIENIPSNDFLSDSQTSKSSFSRFASFEPFFDFSNFVLKLSATFHFPPLALAEGTDTTGKFNENSDAISFTYGGKILLVPATSQSRTSRAYLVLGLSYAIANLKNTRNYTVNGVNTNTYVEKVKGKSQEFVVGAGGEFMFLQNYSLQTEIGFQQLRFGDMKYVTSNDLSGVSRGVGTTAVNSKGENKTFSQTGFYGSLSLNLNF